jgi:Xaa-Pro aminopeptidase
MNCHSEHLALLRAALKQKSIDAYIIPLSDPHLGEDIPDHWQIVRWLTGFTGSAATAVVTDHFAGLWTDSRYFIQAENELADSGFELMKPVKFQTREYADWLAVNINPGSRIAFDGRIFPVSRFRILSKRLDGKNITFVNNCDLISEIWTDRPPMTFSLAWDHPPEYSGKERSRKIAEVRDEMKKKDVDLHFLTSSDDIMWLLNIRGNDLFYSPLILSFALIGRKEILLFVDENKIPRKLFYELIKSGILVLPYEESYKKISSVKEVSSILISPATTSTAHYYSIPDNLRIVEDISIPSMLKARKNKTEIGNIGKVMVRDGTALTKFFFYFEINHGIVPLTEVTLAEKLFQFRSQQKDFLGPSFAAITAFNEHSALPHYTATPGTDLEIGKRGIFLVDSGGQYMGGTTDITRTIAIGLPTVQQKKDFTLVLRGHINLARVKFPLGTKGSQLDILARQAMWEKGLNYGHGTGHGVGYCLNVHEGPQNISPSDNKIQIEPGMIISDEPAIYREGEYGIRTENLLICFEDEETEFGQFLKFDTISLCYIDKALIDKSLLNREEIAWLNDYHSEVFDKISPCLTTAEKRWLKEKTEPL